MKTVKAEDLPYRRGVGIMLLNAAGEVFVGRRIDQTVESWQMPQGGVDKGEADEEAAMRELGEEVGTDKAEIIGRLPGDFAYDLPPHLLGVALHGKYRGQKQSWFVLRFLGQDSDIDLTRHEPEFAEWRWAKVDELLDLIVPFKREIYAEIVAAYKSWSLAR
ncbi:putative (di)nucleoside polyphosphate hydrolase [Rhizomicrobium palustre]|uniref:RNA pyrophosphohydrolase n=1 Tax=Rhizomicrobium palustre TaxID=189966 RepID=A0A846MWY6_9PROT|nr:RNA pyrophosphohydrolase [Rhizomicrobium palustre]NIK88054.1 putative (di)nucleoside polyphosphate hydrolase [Rhizomicrobium palustre]